MKKYNNGFTLIELLIAITIIGILATLSITNFIGIKQRARDGKRKSDVSQIQAALEQYRADQGSYPADASLSACGSSLKDPDNTITYIRNIPCDPMGTRGTYNSGIYAYTSSGTTYSLVGCLENKSDSQGLAATDANFPVGVATTNCPSNWFYVVNNP